MRGLCGSLLAAVAVAAAAAAAAPTHAAAPPPNPVAAENAQAGTTGWAGPVAPADAVQGYASEPGVAPGDTIHFHVSTAPGLRYRVELYRLGWYGGAGGRLVACAPSCNSDEAGTQQPGPSGDGDQAPIVAPWPVTDTIATGADWPSGYYEARFVLTNGAAPGSAAETFVIVRQAADARPSQILVQVPVNTWQAYNEWGGRSLYDFVGQRALRVSFERPYGTRAQSPFWYELQTVRFLERQGYDVSYQTDVDTDRDPGSLLRHRLVLVNGHDEYWTVRMRNAFEAARDAGTNLAFVGSNIGYWVVRYEDGGNTIFSYKSTYDPNPNPAQKTAMFREIGRPECELMGIEHEDIPRNYTHALDLTVTKDGANDPWLAGTGLHAGDVLPGLVGREYDTIAPWGGCFHVGTVVLFHYEGNPTNPNADAVRYTARSGARVFATGGQRFSWALDDWRSDLDAGFPPVPADARVQQFMRNALDDLTRPAPPAGLKLTRRGTRLHVSVAAWVDPRVHEFVAAAWNGKRWVRLCHGATTCSGRVPLRTPRRLKVGAVALDAWGRQSSAVFALG